jgi:hypothetical protein
VINQGNVLEGIKKDLTNMKKEVIRNIINKEKNNYE